MITAEFIVEMSGHTKLTFRYNGHPHPGQPKKEISDWLLSIMTGQLDLSRRSGGLSA
jgi:hypothetical protein